MRTFLFFQQSSIAIHTLISNATRFWNDRSRTQLQQARSKDSLASITAALSNTQREIANLARTNVYNDAFCIGHDGVFGTVNGLRLGRVAGVNVEWSEINAAWGQALLLLYTIARKVDFNFETYVILNLYRSSAPYIMCCTDIA